jgi:TonB family protein
MSETAWYRMLSISVVLHILVIAALTIPIKFTSKRIDLSSSYSVNLVGGTGSLSNGNQKETTAPVTKTTAQNPTPAAKDKKITAVKTKQTPMKKEKDLVSISNKKVLAKEATTQEEIDQLQRRLKDIKRKTDYIDVTKGGASGYDRGGLSSASGSGADGPLNPLEQKYYLDVQDKMNAVWNKPSMAAGKKNLEIMQVTIKIRKDGKLVDINVDKGSGNRIYDESAIRAIRAAEPLPPIPAALNRDSVEVTLRFNPEDMR